MAAAVLDANVIYPAPLRDYLLHLANLGLYQPKWSVEIQDEWTRNLLVKRKDLNQKQLDRTTAAMDAAFPDANITGYEGLIETLTLPDPDDRHVLASAIHSGAAVIVTNNIKDFPAKIVKAHGINIQQPDDFVAHLIRANKAKCVDALNDQVRTLRNPPRTRDEVLDTLETCGLVKSVKLLRS